jgi:alpha-tubulin suppressor-like RCC1 family protein
VTRAGDPNTTFAALDVGPGFALGISGGRLFGWGAGNEGQLGETVSVYANPEPIEIPLPSGVMPSQVSAGQVHACITSRASEIYCWGSGSNTLILGRGDLPATPPNRPTKVAHPNAASPSPWRSVSVGRQHACAIDEQQDIYCWGQNDSNQLGAATATPTRVDALDLDFTSVSAGDSGTCAITRNRQVYCWGRNTGRVLGLPALDADIATPTRVCLPAP